MSKSNHQNSFSALNQKEMPTRVCMDSDYRPLGEFFNLLLKIDRRKNPERYGSNQHSVDPDKGTEGPNRLC